MKLITLTIIFTLLLSCSKKTDCYEFDWVIETTTKSYHQDPYKQPPVMITTYTKSKTETFVQRCGLTPKESKDFSSSLTYIVIDANTTNVSSCTYKIK